MALGHKSVKEAQRHIDSREFAKWMAFDRLEPIGPRQPNDAAAVIAAAIYNTARTEPTDPWVTPDDIGLGDYASEKERAERERQRLAEKIDRIMGGG